MALNMVENRINLEEGAVGPVNYQIKVPELLKKLGLNTLALVRKCDLSVGTAYKAADPRQANDISLDTAWKIYNGLRESGYDIQWSDVVEIQE